MLKIANIPATYRIPIYQRIAQTTGVSLRVILCSQREPNRQWDLPPHVSMTDGIHGSEQTLGSLHCSRRFVGIPAEHCYEVATQHEPPRLYRSARISLFSTLWDLWGVIINKACAAGLPGENEFVCDLNVSLWRERAALLLTQPDVYQRFAERSRSLVSEYTFDNAASGLLATCRFALSAGEISRVNSPTVMTRNRG